ncbi:pro-adrenomedullin-like [Meriones unguiculatus]|uniref:pro-adrenomedullin-like n=1 Tax=Meriones unguiculatus TaxID=10047 RepID=UPI00293EBDB9|nr:pro-adrenomedullin-like [Meriones unguiculatus]XP_060232044.1 pro-adrenomedullin-like [Meriones unguiculatus]XP_060232236.1 pro-adrenomedullin-like [Meriones unguiculatus]XP_060232386.1 pro-adrenomedullin-like [Meriones unguiculatus]XP_060232394.1 pro-adrenomedullin-like [Meriones unguiculatus]
MKLVSIILIFLGSLAFLGVDTAQSDASSQWELAWNKWALSSGKRELQASSTNSSGLTGEEIVLNSTLVPLQDKESTSKSPQASTPSIAHIGFKHYRPMMNPGSPSSPCRLGTCILQKLAQRIYQLTDKSKDAVAPQNKISPQGYGRRRRRSLPEVLQAQTVVSSQEQTQATAASGDGWQQ